MTPPDSRTTARAVPAELASACTQVALASQADAIAGRAARYLAAPASTAEAAAVLKAAADLALTVVPRGTRSRLDWGRPPSACDLIVDTSRLNSVLEHAAGDLVVSVQAGVQLADLAEVLAKAGQRLALDPPAGGTIGGVVATNAAGPLRFRYGAPRDLLIGITIVRADGTVARSGGKVVKNVAGYDLGKLFAGSYGTLGLITEATFRLHPKPAAAATLTLDCPDPQSAQAAAQAMASSPLAPSAIELDWPSAAAPLTVSVLLEGSQDSVTDRTGRMRALLEDQATARDTVSRGNAPTDSGTVLRVAFWPGQLASVLDVIRMTGADEGLDPAIGGSAAAGVLHVRLGAAAPAANVARFVDALRVGLGSPAEGADDAVRLLPSPASALVLEAPPNVRAAVDVWGPVPGLALMHAVKDQFDPEHRMSPGRFAGGI